MLVISVRTLRGGHTQIMIRSTAMSSPFVFDREEKDETALDSIVLYFQKIPCTYKRESLEKSILSSCFPLCTFKYWWVVFGYLALRRKTKTAPCPLITPPSISCLRYQAHQDLLFQPLIISIPFLSLQVSNLPNLFLQI